ncbi:MAG: thiol-disulfide isomerase-like thioredoxin [Verrucomicrobiales bacterium]|nr:thiol-disulfide isomerase-like thioredoxin [Verrucomicrobiales bacterium]
MNKFCALMLCAGAISSCALGQGIILRGGGQIQVQGNGVLIFNSPTIVNELPDVSVPLSNTSDSVLFTNGDFLYGKLISIGSQREIRWQHPDSAAPIDFKSTNITQIDLSSTRRSLEETNNCKVDFVNSDSLKGNLISCDKDSVVLDTVYAGQLRLSRAMLESLVIVPPSQPALFEGPSAIEGWAQGKSIAVPVGDSGQFTFRNGAFYATKAASIARDLHLPDTAQIEFDLVWKSTLHMAIALYTDSLQPVSLASKETAPDFGGFYSFQVNSSYLDMMPIKKKDPLKSLGAIAVPALMQRNRAHFDLRASKRDHKLALLINGVLVKEWTDPDGFAGQGTAMRFVHQGQGSIKLSNIRIRPWDGQLEQPTPAPTHRPTDSVRLADGTRLNGQIESINNGKLSIATGNSTPQLPISQLRQIDFASQTLSSAQTNSQPVKVLLTPGYTISGQLETWSSDAMTLTSPSFGKAKIDPKAVARLQFTHD